MRQRRIKVAPEDGDAVYHCISRTVNGERLFEPSDREVLRNQMRVAAEYCGVEVLTYVILSNHFHIILRVSQKTLLSDEELLRRYRVLYPKPTKYQTARLEVIRAQLKTGGKEADTWRRRQLAQMGDLSSYMKLVKQRFSIWFNKTHRRYGTLWAERFKSVLVEFGSGALRTSSAYVDLNGVRAGLVVDPKDYRFCGYAEAVAGNRLAQQGLCKVLGIDDWNEAHQAYRQIIFSTGATPHERKANLSLEQLTEVVQAKGRLPLATVLRSRMRYLIDGAVLGSRAFVEEHLAAYRRNTGTRSRTAPRLLPDLTDWGDLAILRGIRKNSLE
ncbi:MAG TPA: transposase [Opitutaceae bacterium]|nr:transposase [Opitutaceae bacterium]